MKAYMISHRLTYLLLVIGCLLLTACSDRDDAADQLNDREVYISLAVTVSEGRQGTMRADWWPEGGEHGNRTEAGFPRENMVTGITLMLFKVPDADDGKWYDKKGFCTEATAPTLDFIRYYTVTESNILENVTQGNQNGLKAYTTGKQPLGKNSKVDLKAKYYAVALANCYPSELKGLAEGVSTINDIKDLTVNGLYSGDAKRPASDCTNFMMGLEDYTILDFGAKTPDVEGNGDIVYNMNANSIGVERMVARLDFWAANSEGYKTQDKNGKAYPVPGYVYKVYNDLDDETNDRFVITHITPFNLNSGTEYIFKRDREIGKTQDVYLGPEDTCPYIIDPATLTEKTSLATPSTILNPLSGITSDGILADNTSEPYKYRHSIADMHDKVSSNNGGDGKSGGFIAKDYYDDISSGTAVKTDIDEAEDVIVAYTMENTMPIDCPLYYYATGMIIEGDYYTNDDATSTPEHRVYYGFMRHASETLAPAAYNALTRTDFDDAAKIAALKNVHPTKPTNPMFYGVVRNNIYRVHIGKVFQRGGLSFSIRVKRWDSFTHEVIYM